MKVCFWTRCGVRSHSSLQRTRQDAGVCGSLRYVWATHLLEGVDLVLHLLAARTYPADKVRVVVATRTLLRWFAAPALVRGSTGRQTPAGCDLKSASRIAAVQIVAVEVPLTALETMVTQHSFAS